MDTQKGERSTIMVAKEFAPILDGCSYVDKLVWDGSPIDLQAAVKKAESISSDVVVTQLVGPYEAIKNVIVKRNGYEYKTTTESFQKDQWMLAGRISDWKKQPPLVFDARNREREADLLARFNTKKKLILVSGKGTSSPFALSNTLLTLLRTKFRHGYEVVDLSTVKAERFYDLLGLFEAAHCLVTIDTAHLHLAYACPTLPVVALVNDKPTLWHGSVWRPNHICHVRYGDFDARCGDILKAIEGIGWNGCWFSNARPLAAFHHVWSRYEGEWRGSFQAGSWIETPIEVGALGRDTQVALKDKKRFPFVKDVLRLACLRAKDTDRIVLTRNDTEFPALPDTAGVPGYAHRIQDGNWHPGCDLFVFTKEWWEAHRREYPDMVMGRDYWWHRILKELVLKHGGKELPFQVTRNKETVEKSDPKEPPKYYARNKELGEKWLKENGIQSTFPPVDKQVEVMPLQTGSLKRFGYNPGLIRHDGRTLLVYRHHFDNSSSTRLRIAELDGEWHVISDRGLNIPDSSVSVEDANFFTRRGELWLSWVDSKWAGRSPLTEARSVVKFGRIEEGTEWTVNSVIQPDYGKNDYSIMEKNWRFWGGDNDFYCLYQSSPVQTVLRFEALPRPLEVFESPSLKWKWGPLKGGSNPVPYRGKLLRFFHSTLDNEPAPWGRRYYIGAMIMEPEPPFAQVALSSKPVIYGSEYNDLPELARGQCFHFKGNVVFPGGCVPVDGGWLLALGVNDSRCAIAKLKETDLNLQT